MIIYDFQLPFLDSISIAHFQTMTELYRKKITQRKNNIKTCNLSDIFAFSSRQRSISSFLAAATAAIQSVAGCLVFAAPSRLPRLR
jgi:hypothetical protein